MNKAKILFITGFAVLASVFGYSAVTLAEEANIQQGLCSGANLTLNPDADCAADQDAATENVNSMVKTVIDIFSWIVGVVSVIMIIWGGFKYITSGGDSSNVTAAKNTILYAIVGLIIVALAQIIVKFVLGTVSSNTGS